MAAKVFYTLEIKDSDPTVEVEYDGVLYRNPIATFSIVQNENDLRKVDAILRTSIEAKAPTAPKSATYNAIETIYTRTSGLVLNNSCGLGTQTVSVAEWKTLWNSKVIQSVTRTRTDQRILGMLTRSTSRIGDAFSEESLLLDFTIPAINYNLQNGGYRVTYTQNGNTYEVNYE